MERESMEFDVVIVGAGPAGLSSACRLMQCAKDAQQDISVCVVEKGSEVGAHILSGAVLDPRALNELFPDWKIKGAPLHTPVSQDDVYYLNSANRGKRLPGGLIPPTMKNEGNYIISLGNLCRWLAEQAEQLGVEIFPGFSAQSLIIEDNTVKGVITGDMGIAANREQKTEYMPGMELRAKYTLFAEGCRGHLGKQLIQQFKLDEGKDPQHYAIGIKELWQVPDTNWQQGKVVHTAGWPLSETNTTGGGFMYHLENNEVVVGLVTDLNYSHPYLDPFQEFQQLKRHPIIKKTLDSAKRVSYGARAITKGGLQSLPKMTFPGGLLIGCDAGTLNSAKIKGSHTAMKSGMLAAECVYKALEEDMSGEELTHYSQLFEASWLYKELYEQRNFAPLLHRYGTRMGGVLSWLNMKLNNKLIPCTLKDSTPDYTTLKKASECQPIGYPKPDGIITFDRMSSVFISNTNHEEDQPCHLRLTDSDVPLKHNLPSYAEPAQRYCPAGVYEIVEEDNEKKFVINAQNCVHCKTCDIKDPAQNITWVSPEGGGGPNYPNM